MARKSNVRPATDAIVSQTTNADATTARKKRKRKERESMDAPDVDGTIANAAAHIVEDTERKKKKKKKKRHAPEGEAGELAAVASPPDQVVVVDDSTSASPERKKRKKQGKEGKHRAQPSSSNPLIDPALTALDRGNSTNANAFLSAVVAAASGPAAQDHSQTADYPHHVSSFENPAYQNVPPGLEGAVVSFSGEDLARALQGLDVAKLADALQALGDAGSSNFPLPGQPGPSQAGAATLQNPLPLRQPYDHGAVAQNASMPIISGSGNDHNQMPVSSAAILGQPIRNLVKAPAARKVIPISASHVSTEDHAHLLANKWLSATKLNELSNTIGLQYKKGKFSASEEALLKHAIEAYRIRNGLSHEQLNEVIFAKGLKGKDNAFWFEITAQVPSRPVVAVYHHVRRSFHPLKQQGKWMPTEDDVLRQAVADLGQSWEKVSQLVGRMASDCRDRWRNHINNREGRVFGPWTKEEEDRLTQIVMELTTAQGKNSDLDVFWTQVAARMGNSRGRHQCRIKWTDSLSKTVKNDGQKPRWSQQDAYILVHKIASLNVNDDSEIDWKLLIDDDWNLWSAHTLQRRWLTLKRSVRGHEEMTHQEIMDILRVKKAHLPPMPAPVRRRVTSAPVVPADAQASDVAIEDTFPPAGGSGFGDISAIGFGGGSPMDASQPQPHSGNFSQDGFGQAVAAEPTGAELNNDRASSGSCSSSDSD